MYSELFQKQYDFELEQRNSIASATNIPIVAITVVASATCAILIDFQYKQSMECYAFIAFAVSAILAFVFSVSCLFRSFWNYEYHKLPTSSLLKQHHDSLKTWHLGNGNSAEEAMKTAEADFADFIEERLAKATDRNSQNNIVRGNYLHLATAAVAYAVVFLLPAGGIYIYNKASRTDKIQSIKIVDPISIKDGKMASNSSSGGNNPPAAPATAPTINPKPAGPPNTAFKGNTDMPKPNANSNSNSKK